LHFLAVSVAYKSAATARSDCYGQKDCCATICLRCSPLW